MRPTLTSGKDPITTFIVYTIVKADEVKASFLNYLSDTIGDDKMQAEFWRFINHGGYVILELRRIVDLSSSPSIVHYHLSGYYRIMVAPADHGPELVHISQLDNDSFIEHLSLVHSSGFSIH